MNFNDVNKIPIEDWKEVEENQLPVKTLSGGVELVVKGRVKLYH